MKKRVLAILMAVLLLMGSLSVGFAAVAEEEYADLKPDTPVTVSGSEQWFTFTPPTDGVYFFRTRDNTDCDPVLRLEDADGNLLAECDDRGDGDLNSLFSTPLTGNIIYFLQVRNLTFGSTGSFVVEATAGCPVTGVEIVEDSLSCYEGAPVSIAVNITPWNGLADSVEWSSTNTEVVGLDEWNTPWANTPGQATVTVKTSNGISDSVAVTVLARPQATGMYIDRDEKTPAYVGTTEQLSAYFIPEEAVWESYTWKSNAPTVATVSAEGLVTFLATGEVTVTVTSERGLTASVTLQVQDVEALVPEQPMTVQGGGRYTFTPAETGYYTVNTDGEMFFVLFDQNPFVGNSVESISSVSISDGFWRVKLTAGTTYYWDVSESSGGTDFWLKQCPRPTGMEIMSGSPLVGYVGDGCYVEVAFTPADAYEGVVITLEDDAVAMVEDATGIRMLAPGKTTLTVTSESGLQDEITVIVRGSQPLEEGDVVPFALSEDNAYSQRYTFTPAETGTYSLSASAENDGWFSMSCQGETSNGLDWFDAVYTGDGCFIQDIFFAGVTYTVDVVQHDGDPVTGTLSFVKKPAVTKLDILSYPTAMTYLAGGRPDYDGLELKATFADGTTATWQYDEYTNGYLNGYEVDIQEAEAEPGMQVEVWVGDQSVSLTFREEEDPVVGMELAEVSGNVFYQNTNGNFSQVYNPETEEVEEVFRYNPYTINAKVRLLYRDGTSEVVWVSHYNDGENPYFEEMQTEQWVLGDSNRAVICFRNHSLELPVTLLASPITGLEVVSGHITLTEGMDGYESDNGFIYHYEMTNDVQLLVTYADGRTETAGMKELAARTPNVLFTADEQNIRPWTVGGDNTVTLKYFDQTVDVPVVVQENPVERLELLATPTRVYVYGDSRWGDYDLSTESYWLYPTDLTGLSFRVWYKDGTGEEFTSADFDRKEWKIDGYAFEVSAVNGEVQPQDTVPVRFVYRGCTLTYNVTVIPSAVKSIEMTKAPTRTAYTKGYDPEYYGAEFTVTFTDGTTQAVTVTRENLTYARQNYGTGYTCHVPVGDEILKLDWGIIPGGTPDEPVFGYRATIGDQCVVMDCFTFAEETLTGFEVNGFNLKGNQIEFVFTYKDGSVDRQILDLTVEHSSEYDALMRAHTEKGVLLLSIYNGSGSETERMYDVYWPRTEHSTTAILPAVSAGDVDESGEVAVADALAVLQAVTGKIELTADLEQVADVTADGNIGVDDALAILQFVTGKITRFPSEE